MGEPLRARGFRLEVPLPPCLSRGAILSLRAVDHGGRRFLLSASSLDAALLDGARLDASRALSELAEVREELAVAKARNAGLAARIESMQTSRFWWLRNRWFAAKRLLRLTDEA